MFKQIRVLLLSVAFIVTGVGCASDPGQSSRAINPKYNADALADKWRGQYLKKQQRRVPAEPAPSPYSYPHDNDSEYYYPYRGGYGGAPYIPPPPRYYPPQPPPYYANPYHPPTDFDSSNQYSYPRYDPDADNAPYGGVSGEESYEYPLYFDY